MNDERALARLRAICLAFPEAEEVALQDRPLFRVRSRRFALFNGASSPPRPRWKNCGRSLHFVTDPQEREALRHDRRAPSTAGGWAESRGSGVESRFAG